MDAEQKSLLAEAVNTLIEDDSAQTLYKQLLGVYELARKDVPVRLTGRPGVLNPLLTLMLEDHGASERVIQLIERKRMAANLPPLEDAAQGRRDYMRELMADRRERLRRLVELWNSMRSEKEKIRGAARLEFERVHGARWFAVREEREQALRERLGRRLSVQERTEMLDRFWADVNDELDALEVFAREQMRAGPLQKSVFQFKLQPRKDIND